MRGALLGLVLLSSLVASAAPPPGFAQTLETHLAAIRGRDLPGLLATVDDGVLLLLPNGKLIEGKKAFTAFHREFFADKGWTMELRELHRVITADMALAFFEYTYTDKDDKGAPSSHKNYLALTFRRTGGVWLLVHDQNTRQPQP